MQDGREGVRAGGRAFGERNSNGHRGDRTGKDIFSGETCSSEPSRDDTFGATVHVFVLHSTAQQALEVAPIFIERVGFDLLDCLEEEPPPGYELAFHEGGGYESRKSRAGRRHLFVAIDLFPWTDQLKTPLYNPRFDNQRVPHRLGELNALIADYSADALERRGELLAVTLTTTSAWRLLNDVVPHKVCEYEREISNRRRQMVPPFPCRKEITGFGNNARTYLVEYGKALHICKVFRPGRVAYLENELRGLSLSEQIKGIPKCIEAGSNWVLTQYFADASPLSAFKNRYGLVPLRLGIEAFKVLRAMHDKGLAHLDFRPEHVLVRGDGTVKVIDFDRIHIYDEIPPFEESLSIVGCRDTLLYDAPNGPPLTYERVWESCIGLDVRTFIRSGRLVQHARRARVMISRAWNSR